MWGTVVVVVAGTLAVLAGAVAFGRKCSVCGSRGCHASYHCRKHPESNVDSYAGCVECDREERERARQRAERKEEERARRVAVHVARILREAGWRPPEGPA